MEQQLQTLEATLAPAEIRAFDELAAAQNETAVTPLTEEELKAFTAFLHTEARRARGLNRLRNGVFCLWVTVWTLSVFFWHQHTALFGASIHVSNLLFYLATRRFKSDRHKQAVATLTKSQDVRVVGPLTEVFALPEKTMYPLAADALVVLLPQLRATDAGLLNTQQRALLRAQLKGDNKALILAILHAYEQIGDARDLLAVQALLDGKTRLGWNAEVWAAAKACIPFLEINDRRHQASQTLLRASEHPLPKAEELLRPAQAVAHTDPQQLLRATDEN